MFKPAKIAILISGRGSNMAAIVNACQTGEIPAIVVAVLSDRADAPGLQIANSNDIETAWFERKNYNSKSEHEAAMLGALDGFQPDLICLAGFMRVLSGNFVSQYAGKILNIHPSLLPKYKGLDTHQRVLENGDKHHGCTVHFVTEGLDDGPIVLQKSIGVDADDNAEMLAEKVLAIEHQLYVDAINCVLKRS